MRNALKKAFRYFGLLSFIVAFLGITISVYLNPWFDVTKNALSDLGRVGLETSFIFNSSLFISSILALLYAYHLLSAIPGKLGCIGIGVYVVGIFSLMAISIFPEGTKPHLFVSWEFFTLMIASLLVFGISLAKYRKIHGYFLIGLFFLSLLGSYFINWPSTATLEIYNLVCYFIGFLILFKI